MKRVVTIALACLLGVASLRPSLAAEPDTYVFDVLRHAQYRLAYIKLFKGQTVPDWVMAVVKGGEGVAGPGKSVTIGAKAYRLDHVCKAHDCGGNALAILWSAGGQRVWAALVDGGAAPIFFGTPSPDQTETLSASAKNG